MVLASGSTADAERRHVVLASGSMTDSERRHVVLVSGTRVDASRGTCSHKEEAHGCGLWKHHTYRNPLEAQLFWL